MAGTRSPASGSRCPSAPRLAAVVAARGQRRDRRFERGNGSSPGPRRPMAMTPNERPSPSPGQYTNPLQPVLFEVKRTIVGQDVLLERMAIALLSGGHLLVEGEIGRASCRERVGIWGGARWLKEEEDEGWW